MQVILEKLDLHMARRRARALLPASKRDRIVAAHADRLARLRGMRRLVDMLLDCLVSRTFPSIRTVDECGSRGSLPEP